MSSTQARAQAPDQVRPWTIDPNALHLLRFAWNVYKCVDVVYQAHWKHQITLGIFNKALVLYQAQVTGRGIIDQALMDQVMISLPKKQELLAQIDGDTEVDDHTYPIDNAARWILEATYESYGHFWGNPPVALSQNDHQAALRQLRYGIERYSKQVDVESHPKGAETCTDIPPRNGFVAPRVPDNSASAYSTRGIGRDAKHSNGTPLFGRNYYESRHGGLIDNAGLTADDFTGPMSPEAARLWESLMAASEADKMMEEAKAEFESHQRSSKWTRR